jgi:hypothetical protein
MSISKLKRTLQETKETSQIPSGLLIGIIVGGVAVIVFIIVLTFMCMKRRRKSKILEKDQIKKIIEENLKVPDSPMINHKFEKDNLPSKPVLNLNPMEEDITDAISHRSVDQTNRQLFEKKKYEADSNSKSSMNPVIDHLKAEKNFKKAIQLVDTNDDKMNELVMHSPRYIPNKNIDLEMYENKVEEKTVKDIITNNINMYTDGNREDFYTEGSRKSYVSSVESNTREVKIPTKRPSGVEKEMTPEEHSDFLDGEDFFQNEVNVVIKLNQYNTDYSVNKTPDRPETKGLARKRLSIT